MLYLKLYKTLLDHTQAWYGKAQFPSDQWELPLFPQADLGL